MDIQQRLTGFAMMGATWVMWVLAGLSVGGIAVALQRVIYLFASSTMRAGSLPNDRKFGPHD